MIGNLISNHLVTLSGFWESEKTREGGNCRFQITPRTEGWFQVQGSVDPRLAVGLPFPMPEILGIKACRDSRNVFRHFHRIFVTPEKIPETATTFSSFLREFSGIFQQAEVYPTRWARGLPDQIQKGRSRHRTSFIKMVIETMVSDHGLGRGQTMG